MERASDEPRNSLPTSAIMPRYYGDFWTRAPAVDIDSIIPFCFQQFGSFQQFVLVASTQLGNDRVFAFIEPAENEKNYINSTELS